MGNSLKTMLAFICLAGLVACQQIGEGGRMAEAHSKTAIKDTKVALERIFTYYPEVEEYKAIPYSFCYRIMQDITCYDRPIPEARARLVGWQGRSDSYIKDDTKRPPAPVAVEKKVVVAANNPTRAAVPKVPASSVSALKPLEPVQVGDAPAVKEDKVKVSISNSTSSTLY